MSVHFSHFRVQSFGYRCATCWGSHSWGADCPAQGVDWAAVEVYSTGAAFLALDRLAQR